RKRRSSSITWSWMWTFRKACSRCSISCGEDGGGCQCRSWPSGKKVGKGGRARMLRARQQQENRPRRGFAIRLDPALLVMTVLVMVLLRTFPAYALAPEDIVWGGRWMMKTEARF